MTEDTRKRRDYGKPGTFQFRHFSDVASPETRSVKGNLKQAALNSKADSLLRKFSWEKDEEKSDD